MSVDTAAAVASLLRENSNPGQAALLQRYFKTGVGEYGEGDIFIGLKVPQVRAVARRAKHLPTVEIARLMASDVHEDRLCGLHILTAQFERARTQEARAAIFHDYLEFLHAGRVNNWDLIDTSAPRIAEALLQMPDASQILDSHAASTSLWDRRFAIMATWPFLRIGDASPTLRIAATLLTDKHDLIHKAVGWMLRELGKTQPGKLRDFLDAHVTEMPRTMLRYAIEKFPEVERQLWLSR